MRGLLEFLLHLILLWGAALVIFGIHSFSFDSPLLLFIAMLGVGVALALIAKRWGRGMLLLAIPIAVLLANYSAQMLWSPGDKQRGRSHVYRLAPEHYSHKPNSIKTEAPYFAVQSHTLPRACTDTQDDSVDISMLAGFDLHPIACGLQGVGDILVAPGESTEVLYATKPEAGTLYRLQAQIPRNPTSHEKPPATSMWSKQVLSSGLDRPMGLAWYSGALYVATRTAILRFNMAPSSTEQSLPETVISGLPPAGITEHRALVVDSDGNIYLFIGAGDAAPHELHWQQAAVIQIDPDAKMELYAAGLHHARGLALHPRSGALWAIDEAPESLNTHTPADEINILKIGGDYGWPFCYGFGVPDSELGTTTICESTQPPVALLPPQSKPVDLAFGYKLKAPQRYRSMLYVALKGRIDDPQRHGFRIVGLPLNEQGDITGWVVDVVSGLATPTRVYAQPAALALSTQGDLYFADAYSGMVYRFEFPFDADMQESMKD